MNLQTRILEGILDIGEAMLCSGTENFRLDDTLYRMCKSYGFERYDVFAIPSNIQITVKTPDGEFLTQIRHIESTGINYDRLDYLNNLARYVCQNTPDADELHEKFLEVMNREEQPLILIYAAGMGGTGFAVFFGCGLMDALVAALVSLIVFVATGWESNLLIYPDPGVTGRSSDHRDRFAGNRAAQDRIMIGIVILLRCRLVRPTEPGNVLRDFISGLINIMNSILGAAGIALWRYRHAASGRRRF